MDVDKIMREIQRQITEKQYELLAGVKDVIEQQYCSVHGKFAEFEGVEGGLGSQDGARMRFSVCCEDLRTRVQEAINSMKADQQ